MLLSPTDMTTLAATLLHPAATTCHPGECVTYGKTLDGQIGRDAILAKITRVDTAAVNTALLRGNGQQRSFLEQCFEVDPMERSSAAKLIQSGFVSGNSAFAMCFHCIRGGEDTAFALCFSLPSWLRHRICLAPLAVLLRRHQHANRAAARWLDGAHRPNRHDDAGGDLEHGPQTARAV